MFMIAVAEDVVRIPPRYFALPLKQAAFLTLSEKYNGTVDPDHKAVVVAVTDIREIEEYGRLVPDEPGTWHRVVFELLLYRPEPNEVVEGVVQEIVEHGMFVNIGPLDGYVHISQVAPVGRAEASQDSVIVEVGGERLVIRRGDAVRARVQAVSFRTLTRMGMPRVSLTMRGGEFLGKLEWIEEKVKKLAEARG